MAVVAVVGGGLLAAGGSIWGGMQAKKGKEKEAKAIKKAAQLAYARAQQGYARQSHHLDTGRAAIELRRKAEVASAATKKSMYDWLGMPGTFEGSYEDYVISKGSGGILPATQSELFKPLKKKVTTRIPGDEGLGIPGSTMSTTMRDFAKRPDEWRESFFDSRIGRAVSHDIAQWDQAARQEGELYLQLKESIQGPIIEGAGIRNQEVMEAVDRAFSVGTARNRLAKFNGKMQAQQSINRDKQNALWQSNAAMIQMATEQRRQSIAFGMAVVDQNVVESFDAQMNALTQLYLNNIMPTAMAIESDLMDNMGAADSLTTQAKLTKIAGDTQYKLAIAGAVQQIGGAMMQYGMSGMGGGAAASPATAGAAGGGSTGAISGGGMYTGMPQGISANAGGYRSNVGGISSI